MKILIVSANFNPPTSTPRGHRTVELVKEFSRRGEQVTVLLPKTKYNYSEFESQYQNVKFQFLNVSCDPIIISKNFFIRFFQKLLYRLILYPNHKLVYDIPRTLKHASGYDLLISIANPMCVHWGVDRALRCNPQIANVWIADCGDPFMLNPVSKIPMFFYFKGFEKSFCRRADFLTVPTKGSVNGYYPEFHNKIHTIPQGFNFDEVILDEYIPTKVITFAYAGIFYNIIRDPRPILDEIIKLNIDFKFIVYTKNTSFLDKYKSILGDKLEIHSYIPRLELLKQLSKVDFILNIENSNISVQTPSKLIDYFLVKRPILSIDCQNIDIENLKRFFSRDYSGEFLVNDTQEYNIKNICSNFLKLYENAKKALG